MNARRAVIRKAGSSFDPVAGRLLVEDEVGRRRTARVARDRGVGVLRELSEDARLGRRLHLREQAVKEGHLVQFREAKATEQQRPLGCGPALITGDRQLRPFRRGAAAREEDRAAAVFEAIEQLAGPVVEGGDPKPGAAAAQLGPHRSHSLRADHWELDDEAGIAARGTKREGALGAESVQIVAPLGMVAANGVGVPDLGVLAPGRVANHDIEAAITP